MLLEKRRKSTFFWLIVSRKYCTLSQPKDMFKRMQQATNNKHSVFISDLKNPLLFKFFVVVFLLQDLGGSTKKNYRFFFVFAFWEQKPISDIQVPLMESSLILIVLFIQIRMQMLKRKILYLKKQP